ncbi:MAG: cytochrome P450 [Rhodospirillaceae bacterium]|jgi:cytochrome P450|nr:cytochrome P450 [Rhodospirillaceae bacterium]MBT4115225.1 cytochrome P450 [Rhodospirillaceae bacterium]MBT4671735.1 cytochrome P450 [Rhodospirillaceae bacterium]MBT4751559.1 cytochrome P450 [Rhodospirillaceae bacterium]MBT5179376.1 cytochrome P450 [Rhodospirillaceae bacterium]
MSDTAEGLGMFQSVPGEYEAYQKASTSECPVSGMGAEFMPFSEEYLADPYAFFRRARAEEPVFFSAEMDAWVVMNYDDIVAIFQDPETYSAALARHPVTPLCPAAATLRDKLEITTEPSLVDEDPATHRDHRRIFGDAFTPKRLREIEPRIRAIVTRYIDRFIDDGEADLVKQMLYEVPALAIFIFLGASDEDAVKVKILGSKRALVNWGRPSDEEQVEMMAGMGEHWDFTKRLVDAALENPGDNYMGDMVRIYRDDPSKFTINYLYNVAFLMQFAGHETTTQASANGIKALLEDRGEWEAICANPDKMANAVEEILRIDSSIFAWRRIATRDTEIAGHQIMAGQKILLMLGSGSHDDAMFPGGAKFDHERRNAKRNLAFGHGAHFCMGAPLARLEMKIILEELTRRLPHMQLSPDQDWEYIPTLTFRGVQKLLVEWDVEKNPG